MRFLAKYRRTAVVAVTGTILILGFSVFAPPDVVGGDWLWCWSDTLNLFED